MHGQRQHHEDPAERRRRGREPDQPHQTVEARRQEEACSHDDKRRRGECRGKSRARVGEEGAAKFAQRPAKRQCPDGSRPTGDRAEQETHARSDADGGQRMLGHGFGGRRLSVAAGPADPSSGITDAFGHVVREHRRELRKFRPQSLDLVAQIIGRGGRLVGGNGSSVHLCFPEKDRSRRMAPALPSAMRLRGRKALSGADAARPTRRSMGEAGSAQAQEPQDEQDDYDQADDVYDVVHLFFPLFT